MRAGLGLERLCCAHNGVEDKELWRASVLRGHIVNYPPGYPRMNIAGRDMPFGHQFLLHLSTLLQTEGVDLTVLQRSSD